ncbi:MAG TPA: hypothetical protein ENJ01_06780 [Gammaproteobacteria bacterium]|nr:hypothetical protein [Gammaproteobacteria bacterium]
MSLLLSLPLLLSLILLVTGLYLGARHRHETAPQLSVAASVNQCFLTARLGALGRVCIAIFILLLLFTDILTALGFAIGAFANGFLAWRFPQRSYQSADEDAETESPPARMAAGIVAAALAVLTVGGYLTLLGLMTPSGQALDARPLWGLGLGASLAAWLMRIRPATRWVARRLCSRFPAHCQGSAVHPLVWFELLSLALILLAATWGKLTHVWAAGWLIIAFAIAALLVQRLLAGLAQARADEHVVFTLLAGVSLFLATQPLYLPTDMSHPWQELLGPIIAGVVLVWLLLLVAGNTTRYAGRLTLLTLALLVLFIVYGRDIFGEHSMVYFLLGILCIAPIMYYLGADAGGEAMTGMSQKIVALRFAQLVAAVAGLILVTLLSRARYLALPGGHGAFYEALLPAGILLLAAGIFASNWLRSRDDRLLLRWSGIHPATPVNRHSREWPMLVQLGRRFSYDRLLPLALVTLLPPLALLAGYPAWGLAAVVTVLLVLLPRVISDSLHYRPEHARESQLFDLVRIALVLLFLLDPLQAVTQAS